MRRIYHICKPQLKQTAAFDWRNTHVGNTQIVCHSLMIKFGEKETLAFAKATWYSPIKAMEIIILGVHNANFENL